MGEDYPSLEGRRVKPQTGWQQDIVLKRSTLQALLYEMIIKAGTVYKTTFVRGSRHSRFHPSNHQDLSPVAAQMENFASLPR